MNKVTIEIDLDEVKKRLMDYAVTRVVNEYFDADDISDYDKKKSTRVDRLKAVIGEVDWNKLPEEFKTSIVRKFVDQFMTKLDSQLEWRGR